MKFIIGEWVRTGLAARGNSGSDRKVRKRDFGLKLPVGSTFEVHI